MDCSVRALCDHSKACEIEHKLECVLGEKVKTRSTIRPGRMGACGGGGLQPDVVARPLDQTRVMKIVQIVEEKKPTQCRGETPLLIAIVQIGEEKKPYAH